MGSVVGLTISSGKLSELKKACVASLGGNDGLSDRMGEQGGVGREEGRIV